MGVLTQIDNMTAGLMKKPDGVAGTPATPEEDCEAGHSPRGKCVFGPHGWRGVTVCRYCGQAPSDGVEGTAPVQPKRYRWDQETDDTFGFMVGPVPDGEWVKWADVAHVYGVKEGRHG